MSGGRLPELLRSPHLAELHGLNVRGPRFPGAYLALFASLPKFQDPYYGQLSEYLVHGHARPGVPIYPEISNQIQIMMGEVLSGSKAPEEALDGAWQLVMDAYSKS